MAKVEQKQPIVAEISEAIKDAASIVLVVKNFANIWKDRTQSLSAKMMQLLLQESWLNMQKM